MERKIILNEIELKEYRDNQGFYIDVIWRENQKVGNPITDMTKNKRIDELSKSLKKEYEWTIDKVVVRKILHFCLNEKFKFFNSDYGYILK